jgi:aquaporin related protein
MFLTAQLVFTIFMLATEKHEGTFIAPVGIGLSLFVAELMGVFYTGGSVNPARSFGPAVITHSFHSYHWIYWVGPMLGALLASLFYMFIKALEYETVNLVADPKAALGEKFDRSNRPNTQDTSRSVDKIVTGNSGHSGDTFHQSPTLENGHAPHA